MFLLNKVCNVFSKIDKYRFFIILCLLSGISNIIIQTTGSPGIYDYEWIPDPTPGPHRPTPGMYRQEFNKGLTGYWSFDENSGGVTYDISDSDIMNDGILMNGPEWVQDGVLGGGISFDGVDDYINLGSSFFGTESSGKISFAFWMKVRRFSGGASNYILSGGKYGYPFSIHLRPDMRLASGIRTDSIHYVESLVSINPGQWYHIAVSYTGGEQILYINGREENRSLVYGRLTTESVDHSVNIAAYGDPGALGTGFFDGCLDELRIYNQAISPVDAVRLYRAASTGNKLSIKEANPLIRRNHNTGAAVSGRVSTMTNGQSSYLSGVHILILSSSGVLLDRTQTGKKGFYRIMNLPEEEVIIEALPIGTRYASEYYENKYTIKDAALVCLKNGEETGGINFILEEGGVVSGTVLNAVDGIPVSSGGVVILARDAYSGEVYTSTEVNFNPAPGQYELNLPHGHYKIFAMSIDNIFKDIYYNSKKFFKIADVLDITHARNNFTNIDFYLEENIDSIISGRITTVQHGRILPLEGVIVTAVSHEKETRYSAVTGAGGYYSISGIPPGEYLVRAIPRGTDYAGKYWNEARVREEAVPILIDSAMEIRDIDFDLEAGGVIEGTIYTRDNEVVTSGITVMAVDPFTGFVYAHADTGLFFDPGNFSLNVPYGEYKIRVVDKKGIYSGKFYKNSRFMELGDSVFIDPEYNLARDINLYMDKIREPVEGVVRGKITDFEGKVISGDVELKVHPVFSFPEAGTQVSGSWVDYSTGEFEINLPGGYYKLEVIVRGAAKQYSPQFYNEKNSYNQADILVIDEKKREHNGLRFFMTEEIQHKQRITGYMNLPPGVDGVGYKYRAAITTGEPLSPDYHKSQADTEEIWVTNPQKFVIDNVPGGLYYISGILEILEENSAGNILKNTYTGVYGSGGPGDLPITENCDTAVNYPYDLDMYLSESIILPRGSLDTAAGGHSSIEGTVTDEAGIPAANVYTRLIMSETDEITTTTFELVTAEDGGYRFDHLPSGPGIQFEIFFNSHTAYGKKYECGGYYIEDLNEPSRVINHKVHPVSGASLAALLTFEDNYGEIKPVFDSSEYNINLVRSQDGVYENYVGQDYFDRQDDMAVIHQLAGGNYYLEVEFLMPDGSRHWSQSREFEIKQGESFFYEYLISYDTPTLELDPTDGTAFPLDHYLYVANEWDWGGDTSILRISANGATEPVGSGFHGASGLAIHPETGELFICDDNNSIYKIHHDGTVTLAGDGFNNPKAMVFDRRNRLIVAEAGNSIKRINLDNGVVETLASGFPKPRGVGVYGRHVYFCDNEGYIYRIGEDEGEAVLYPAESNRFIADPVAPGFEGGFTIDRRGTIYVSDNSGRIMKVTGNRVKELFFLPGFQARGLAISPSGDSLLAAGYGSNEIIEMDTRRGRAKVLSRNDLTGGLIRGAFGIVVSGKYLPSFDNSRKDDPPSVSITVSPAKALVNRKRIVIEGLVSKPECRIFVNGLKAMVRNTSFKLNYSLLPGDNILIPTAIDSTGNLTTGNPVHVFLDKKGPEISILINKGNTLTVSRSVTLTLFGDDNSGSGLHEVMISNHDDFKDGTWEPWHTTRIWELTDGDGLKTLYVKGRDRAGNESQLITNSITLDEARMSFSGHVVDGNSNEPIANARVVTYPASSEVYTDSSGFFSIEDLYSFYYEIHLEHSAYRQVDYFEFEAGKEDMVSVSMLPVGEYAYSNNHSRFYGFIRDERGAPMAERVVWFRSAEQEEFSIGIVTNAAGFYDFQGLPEFTRSGSSLLTVDIQTTGEEENINSAVFILKPEELEFRKDWTVHAVNRATTLEFIVRDLDNNLPEFSFSGELWRRDQALLYLFDSTTAILPHAYDPVKGILTFSHLSGNDYYIIYFGGPDYQQGERKVFVRRGVRNTFDLSLEFNRTADVVLPESGSGREGGLPFLMDGPDNS